MKKVRMDTQTILVFVIVSILAVLLALRQQSNRGDGKADFPGKTIACMKKWVQDAVFHSSPSEPYPGISFTARF
jgi:hypothetical protein